MKNCKVCKSAFEPRSPMQVVCGWQCAAEWTLRQKAKKEAKARLDDKRQDRAKKEALKSRQDWLKEAQTAVNKYVRLRDHHLGCVSCDKPASWQGQWHASHFRSVGASPATRFNLWNIHKACSVCNNYLSGNLSEYEPRLRAKIGDEKVDLLRSMNHQPKYSVEYLKRLKNVYTRKAHRLRRNLTDL